MQLAPLTELIKLVRVEIRPAPDHHSQTTNLAEVAVEPGLALAKESQQDLMNLLLGLGD